MPDREEGCSLPGFFLYQDEDNMDIGKGSTRFSFDSYTVDASGDIEWTATISDGDPDIDEASAITKVK